MLQNGLEEGLTSFPVLVALLDLVFGGLPLFFYSQMVCQFQHGDPVVCPLLHIAAGPQGKGQHGSQQSKGQIQGFHMASSFGTQTMASLSSTVKRKT